MSAFEVWSTWVWRSNCLIYYVLDQIIKSCSAHHLLSLPHQVEYLWSRGKQCFCNVRCSYFHVILCNVHQLGRLFQQGTQSCWILVFPCLAGNVIPSILVPTVFVAISELLKRAIKTWMFDEAVKLILRGSRERWGVYPLGQGWPAVLGNYLYGNAANCC